MSEIYDALKKISGRKQPFPSEENEKKISGNVIVFRQYFQSPGGILTLVFIIFAIIGLCSFAAYMFLDYLSPQATNGTRQDLQAIDPVPFPDPFALEDSKTPVPQEPSTHLENIPELGSGEMVFQEVEEPLPAVAHLSFNKEQKNTPAIPGTKGRPTTTTPALSQDDYSASAIGPEKTNLPDLVPSFRHDADQQGDFFPVMSSPPPGEGMGASRQESPPLQTKYNGMEDNKPSIAVPVTDSPAPSNPLPGSSNQTPTARSLHQDSWEKSVETTSEHFARKKLYLDNEPFQQERQTTSNAAPPTPVQAMDEPHKQLPGLSRENRSTATNDILAQRIDQGAQTTLMVAKLESLLHMGRTAEAEKLLQDIENHLGRDSIYLLKMKAFFHMKQNQNEHAAEILHQVLARDANDLEAGINMAVLEIIATKADAAEKRLQKLNEVYPGNPHIQRLLEKIH